MNNTGRCNTNIVVGHLPTQTLLLATQPQHLLPKVFFSVISIMTLQLGHMTYHYHTTQQSHPQNKFLGALHKIESGHFHQKNWSQLKLWQSVIVGVDYIISYQQCKFWYKKSASWLATCGGVIPEQSDWCDTWLIRFIITPQFSR